MFILYTVIYPTVLYHTVIYDTVIYTILYTILGSLCLCVGFLFQVDCLNPRGPSRGVADRACRAHGWSCVAIEMSVAARAPLKGM